jgi:hypothetical protein
VGGASDRPRGDRQSARLRRLLRTFVQRLSPGNIGPYRQRPAGRGSRCSGRPECFSLVQTGHEAEIPVNRVLSCRRGRGCRLSGSAASLLRECGLARPTTPEHGTLLIAMRRRKAYRSPATRHGHPVAPPPTRARRRVVGVGRAPLYRPARGTRMEKRDPRPGADATSMP